MSTPFFEFIAKLLLILDEKIINNMVRNIQMPSKHFETPSTLAFGAITRIVGMIRIIQTGADVFLLNL